MRGLAGLAGLVPLCAAACLALTACGTGAPAGAGPTVDPWAVAATHTTAATPTTSTPTTTGAPTPAPSLDPDLQARRQAALTTPEPTRPDGMDQDTPQGAALTAQWVLQLYTYAYTTGDLTTWNQVCTPESVWCSHVADDVQAIHASGGWVDPWELDLSLVEYVVPDNSQDYPGVDITFTNPEATKYEGNGEKKALPPQTDIKIQFALSRQEGHWLIREAEVAS